MELSICSDFALVPLFMKCR